MFLGMLLATVGLFLIAAWIIPAIEEAEEAKAIDFRNWNDLED